MIQRYFSSSNMYAAPSRWIWHPKCSLMSQMLLLVSVILLQYQIGDAAECTYDGTSCSCVSGGSVGVTFCFLNAAACLAGCSDQRDTCTSECQDAQESCVDLCDSTTTAGSDQCSCDCLAPDVDCRDICQRAYNDCSCGCELPTALPSSSPRVAPTASNTSGSVPKDTITACTHIVLMVAMVFVSTTLLLG